MSDNWTLAGHKLPSVTEDQLYASMIPPPMHGRCLIKHSKCFSIPGTNIIAIVIKYNIYTLKHSFQTKCIYTLLGYEFSDAVLAITYHMYDKWSYILWTETQEGFSFCF